MDNQPEVVHIEDILLHDQPSVNLLQFLSNPLILHYTIPLLPISSLLALSAASKSLRGLIYSTPNVFRHLDLTQVKSARSELGSVDHGGQVWMNSHNDEHLTEDDFFGGPLRGIFNGLRKRDILKDVQTLVLDGLTVPSDLVADIVLDQSFSVRLLSIREVHHLNEAKLSKALLYAVRPTRPKGTPKLQGLYIFGPKDPPPVSRLRPHVNSYPPRIMPIDTLPSMGRVMSQGAQIGVQWNQKSGDALWEELEDVDRWYQKSGKMISKPISDLWAGTLQACSGIICFDAVLCRGPRHSPLTNVDDYLPPAVATYAIEGCGRCGTSPEGFSQFRTSPLDHFPLLAPLPLHSSTVKTAKTPSRPGLGKEKRLLARCYDCLRGRFCDSCQAWWCETCYTVPSFTSINHSGSDLIPLGEENVKMGVTRSCFECGLNCDACIERTQLMCRICGGGYCTIHNEGCNPLLSTAGRHAIHGCRC